MSHSPAPWSYRKEDGFAGEHDRYIYDANGEALMSDTPYYPWCPSNEDDWSLIAAAPDLLDALIGMVNMYCELVESGDAGFWDPEKVREVVAARAALAKAAARS